MDTEIVPYQMPTLPVRRDHSLLPGQATRPELLSLPTPDSEKKWLDMGNGRGYWYVRGEYVIRMLNEAYDRQWSHEVHQVYKAPADEKGQIEIIVGLKLYVPGGPAEGYPGLGSDKYRPQNPVDSEANTYLSAETRALKRAARWLGIGLDVNDDPNAGAAIESAQKTIMALAQSLIDQERWPEVKAAFLDIAPQAIDDDASEQLKVYAVTEHQLTPLKKELLGLSRSVIGRAPVPNSK